MVQELDRAQLQLSKQNTTNNLLVETVAYLSVIQRELESRYPMDHSEPTWITQAYQEIEEAKREIQNLLTNEESLAKLAVDQHEIELDQARQEALAHIDWDLVGSPIPPEE